MIQSTVIQARFEKVSAPGEHAGKARGFTLLELLVVLGIIAIVSAMVVPRFGGALHGTAHKTAAKRVAATLRYARSRAVAQGIAYVVVFNLDSDSLSIEGEKPAAGDDDSRNDEEESDIKTYVLPARVSFAKIVQGESDDVEEGTVRVEFYPSGASSGGEIWIRGGRESFYVLTVNFITGVVQMEWKSDRA